MESTITFKSHKALFLNTFAFTVCFGVWMFNGVMVTFLVDNDLFDWGPVKIGWLLGVPVLTGSIFRLPAGILTDKYGGKWVYGGLLLLCSIPLFLLSYADSFIEFILLGFGFGLSGVSFAIGIAFTSVWYPQRLQGTALGIFGAGNAGAALTTLLAPSMLNWLTDNGQNLEGWRELPKIYAAIILVTGVIFIVFSENKKPASTAGNLKNMLLPLKDIRVWRFGMYYFLVFGCFVAFSQWLVPYFVNVYMLPLVTAGILASLFSFPSGIIRAFGGWLSDRFGARIIMYWVLGCSLVISLMLSIPRMEIYSPGKGVMAKKAGVVEAVGENNLLVAGRNYQFSGRGLPIEHSDNHFMIWPIKETWQEPIVKVGDRVKKKQLLIKGQTRIYFQSNVWIFAFLVIIIGSIWGIGKAAVYKHIPTYFPDDVGVVGGMVGVLGGLGGFFSPIIFGYLLDWTGIWSTSWIFMMVISAACLIWMHSVIVKMTKKEDPDLVLHMERRHHIA